MNRLFSTLLALMLLLPAGAAAQGDERSFYQQFKSNPTVESGIAYLDTHPDGQYSTQISNEVCRLLSDRLSEFSIQSDYDTALKYARSTQMRRYAESKIAAAKKAQKKYMKEYDSRRAYASAMEAERRSKVEERAPKPSRRPLGQLFSVGMSFVMDYSTKQYGIGGLINLRLGNPNNVLNGLAGFRYASTVLSDDASSGYTYDQISVPLTLRFNVLRLSSINSGFYIGAGAVYNCNLSASYKESTLADGEKISAGGINKNTWSVLAQIGLGGGRLDGNIFFQYDLKPVVAGQKKLFRGGFEIGWYFLRF